MGKAAKKENTDNKAKKEIKKVLLLTSTSGAGHNVVAACVKAKFEAQGYETKTIDLFAHDPKIAKLISGFWFRAMFVLPAIANFIWKIVSRKKTGFYDKLVKKVKDIIIPQINEFAPDIIVSSHVAGQILTSGYAGEITKPFRDYFIMTDYEVPPLLKPERGKDSFIVVPTNDFKKQLEERGYTSEQLLPFGIPINEKFYKQLDRDEILGRLELPDFDKHKPTILMMGGGKGLGKIAGVVKSLSKNSEIQIITVCGRNEELKKQIDKIAEKNSENAKSHAKIYNFGFCTNVEELMTVAHFSVGKTGGISATEAVAKGLQVVSFKQIPFPELSNLRYLETLGLAKSIKNMAQLEYYIALVPEARQKSDVLVEYSAEKIVKHFLENENAKLEKGK